MLDAHANGELIFGAFKAIKVFENAKVAIADLEVQYTANVKLQNALKPLLTPASWEGKGLTDALTKIDGFKSVSSATSTWAQARITALK